jgi:N-acetylmuramoyl-L-alanine amidase
MKLRPVTHLVVHCTATPHNAEISSIERYWRETLKWKAPGYHKIILASGEVVTLLPDSKIANGVSGHNKSSLHVSWIGGLHNDNRTLAQRQALAAVLWQWLKIYPDSKIVGHRDFPGVRKACPQFDAGAAYGYLRSYIQAAQDGSWPEDPPAPPAPPAPPMRGL